jgi:hypothetical protein
VHGDAGPTRVRGCSQLDGNYRYDVDFTYDSVSSFGAVDFRRGTIHSKCESNSAQTCLNDAIKGFGEWVSPGALAAVARRCCLSPWRPAPDASRRAW